MCDNFHNGFGRGEKIRANYGMPSMWINCYSHPPLLVVNKMNILFISHTDVESILYSFFDSKYHIQLLFCVSNLRHNCVNWKSRGGIKMVECVNTIYTDVKVHWPVCDMAENKFRQLLNNFQSCEKIPTTNENLFFFFFLHLYMYSYLEHRYDVDYPPLITHVLGFCATFVPSI